MLRSVSILILYTFIIAFKATLNTAGIINGIGILSGTGNSKHSGGLIIFETFPKVSISIETESNTYIVSEY